MDQRVKDATNTRRDRSLLEWVALVRDGKVALFVALAIGILAGIAGTALQKTEYQSTGSVVVSSAKGFLSPENADAYPALTDTTRRLLKTPAVLDETRNAYVASAGDPKSAARRRNMATLGWLRNHLTGKQVSITSIIEITGTAPTQAEATALTRAATTSLEKVVGGGGTAGATGGLMVKAFSFGEPKGQVSPTPFRNMLLGINAGVILGIVAALALGARRRVLRRPRDIADELGLPLVGWLRRKTKRDRVAYPGLAEVRARLQSEHVGPLPTALLLTGVTSSKAIGRVAVELVSSMSQSGLRTVLVDADLNARSASAQLSLLQEPGLAESLNGGSANGPVLTTAPLEEKVGVSVLPAGSGATDPALALSGTRLGQTVEHLRGEFDFVVMAGPNLDHLAEVIPLLERADLALLLAPRGIPARRLEPVRMIGDDLWRRFVGVVVLDSED